MPQLSTMRLSALPAALTTIIVIVLILLIGRRLDLRFAGGEGAGSHASATFINFKNLQETSITVPANYSDTNFPIFPKNLARGETVTTNDFTFSRYTLNNECTIALAENSSLTLKDGRSTYNVFNLLTGRAVARGNCIFTTRETEIRIRGTATIVHFSWLDQIVVKVIDGNAVISQSGTATTLTPENEALEFSTLPSNISQKETEFSFTQNDLLSSFYTWSLSCDFTTRCL
jgi:hypothetical protein